MILQLKLNAEDSQSLAKFIDSNEYSGVAIEVNTEKKFIQFFPSDTRLISIQCTMEEKKDD